MNIEKIREAAQSIYDGASISKNVDIILAELDKAQQLGKVLTDEFVRDRAMEIYPPDEVNDGCPWYGHRRAIEDSAARDMVRHLHKLGYLAPAAGLTVDEVERIMDVVTPFLMHKYQETECRARLTAAINAKAAK